MWNCSKKRTIIILFTLILSVTSRADEIEFAWDYGETEIDGFNIYEGIVGADFVTTFNDTPAVPAIIKSLRETTYTNHGKPGIIQKYCYKIRAYRGNTESPDSNTICLKIDNTPLAKPENFNLIEIDGELRLTWDDVDRAKYYAVFYKLNDEYKEIVKIDASMTSVDPAKLPEGIKELVVVAFKDTQTFSQNSDPVEIQIETGELPAPENFCFGSTITN